jgi:hypothetical protein
MLGISEPSFGDTALDPAVRLTAIDDPQLSETPLQEEKSYEEKDRPPDDTTQMTEEVSIEETKFVEPSYKDIDVSGDLLESIKNVGFMLKLKQEMIDAGIYVKTGPGRKCANPPRTSNEIRVLLKGKLRKELLKLILKKKKLNRTDDLVTEYMRIIKKVPHFLFTQ